MNKDLDKNLLASIIIDVDNHNQDLYREEKDRGEFDIRKSKQNDNDSKYNSSKKDDDNERSKWAIKKLLALTDVDNKHNNKVIDRNNNNDDNDNKKKRKRKDEKSKKHKKEKHKKDKKRKKDAGDDNKSKKHKKDKKHKKHKKKKDKYSSDSSSSDSSSSDSNESSNGSSDDDNVVRSSITGKKIKLHRESTDADIQLTMERQAKRQLLNSMH